MQQKFSIYIRPFPLTIPETTAAASIDCVLSLCFVSFAATPGKDFSTTGTKLRFTDVGQNHTQSSVNVGIRIIDDDITEPRETFICTLQGAATGDIQGIEPNRVTIEINDNDGEHTVCCGLQCTVNENLLLFPLQL